MRVEGEGGFHHGDLVALLHLIKQARAAGFTRMGLSTWRSNTVALALYERMGFTAIPAFKNHPDPDLVYLGMNLTALDAVTTHTP